MNPLFRATFKIDIEKMYRSAAWNRRAETHAGRVETLVISRSRIKVRKTDKGSDRQTDTSSGVNASSRLGGTSLVSRLSACLTEANWWRLIAE